MKKTEVWASGNKWRMHTLHVNSGERSIQVSWGQYDQPVDHFIKMFGGSLAMAMDGAYGAGSERWYHRLSQMEAVDRLKKSRKAAERLGYQKLGEI